MRHSRSSDSFQDLSSSCSLAEKSWMHASLTASPSTPGKQEMLSWSESLARLLTTAVQLKCMPCTMGGTVKEAC